MKKIYLEKVTKKELEEQLKYVEEHYADTTRGVGFYWEDEYSHDPEMFACATTDPRALFTWELKIQCPKWYWNGDTEIMREDLLEKLWSIIKRDYQ
mgnify:CR=1 FL=1|jgi:hypothetical protein